MALKDPGTVANLWAQRLGAARQQIIDGVNAVTVAPGQKAAAQVQVWLANTQAAADKWARNTQAVSLQQWQNAMISKGVDRVATGANAAVPKMTQFMQQWLPYEQQVVASLPPRGNLQQNIQRAVTMMQTNAQFQRKPYTGV